MSAASSEGQTLSEEEVVQHKSRSQKVQSCPQSVCDMGRGKGTPELNSLDEGLAAISCVFYKSQSLLREWRTLSFVPTQHL